MQKRYAGHGDDLPMEEAMKDLHIWKNASYAGVAFLAVFVVKLMFFSPHRDAPERKPYSHLGIRRKMFPWGDGNKSLFANLFGTPHDGHGHDDHGHH
jgi:hypothetical protein